MGYWGYYVVGRSERPLAELDALAGAETMTLCVTADDGWQIWACPTGAPGAEAAGESGASGGAGDVGNMHTLARETGAPALFGYVMDSDCVVVEAAGPESGAWTTCLARRAMAAYLGDGEGLTVEDYFLEPRDAAERAVAWAAEAGRAVVERSLVEVLTSEPGPADPLAENILFRLLDRLGVVPM
ncbi:MULTISPECIES: hypothetical protein [unclassified Streptomyces]|uniref:hypothetical protein n=1 Tax=unclassified Streptomyces TaxID=2593676 RepID=UPI002E7A7A12|nr:MULTISPECIES: hypothetical protein [unclassified Streptomyces]MEE1759000.1 hypothetical protein [Streptomyces sp. SP18BB07]MEE1833921.1 hypothetical protein [Streptomyces sp. SP17KL33]